MSDICLICQESLCVGKTCQIREKGITSLQEASKMRHDGLGIAFSCNSQLILHTECRKRYTRASSIKAASKSNDNLYNPFVLQVVLQASI